MSKKKIKSAQKREKSLRLLTKKEEFIFACLLAGFCNADDDRIEFAKYHQLLPRRADCLLLPAVHRDSRRPLEHRRWSTVFFPSDTYKNALGEKKRRQQLTFG